MKRFAELVKVEENNENCVLLKVKPKSSLELMKLGFFTGTEQYFRVTKNRTTHTLTIWHKGESAFSINWGSESTCISETTRKMKEMVVDCIVKDFAISIDK